VLTLNPKNYNATLSLATLYLQDEMFSEAIPLFQAASQLNESDSLPLTSLGLIYLQTHKKKESYLAFKLAL
jgi:Flp pilus assembly protein TadD